MKQYLPRLQRDTNIEGPASAEDEKFISIEYKAWEKRYKPMEENFKKLQAELEKEKRSKNGTLLLETSWNRVDALYSSPIGTIDFTLKDAPQISMEHRERIVGEIQDLIWRNESDSRTYSRYSHNHMKFISREELAEAVEMCNEAVKQKQEVEKRIEERLKGIGKFWKWLLNLK